MGHGDPGHVSSVGQEDRDGTGRALVTVLRSEHDHARLVEGIADPVPGPDGTEEGLIDDDRRVPPPEVERQRLADGIDRGGGADLPLARARGLDVFRPRHPSHGDLVREREGGRDRRAGVRRDLVDGLADRVVGAALGDGDQVVGHRGLDPLVGFGAEQQPPRRHREGAGGRHRRHDRARAGPMASEAASAEAQGPAQVVGERLEPGDDRRRDRTGTEELGHPAEDGHERPEVAGRAALAAEHGDEQERQAPDHADDTPGDETSGHRRQRSAPGQRGQGGDALRGAGGDERRHGGRRHPHEGDRAHLRQTQVVAVETLVEDPFDQRLPDQQRGRRQTQPDEGADDTGDRALQHERGADGRGGGTARRQLAERDELPSSADRERGRDHDPDDGEHDRAQHEAPAHPLRTPVVTLLVPQDGAAPGP